MCSSDLLAVVMLGVRTAVHASVIAYDGFNYSPGATTLNGGIGWSGGWTQNNGNPFASSPVVSGGLTYSSVVVTGNMISGRVPYVRRTTSSQFSGANQTFWVSLLLDSNAQDSNFYLTETGGTDQLGFSFRNPSPDFNLPTTAKTPPASNFILLKLVFNGADNSVTVNGWANPNLRAGEAGLGTPGLTGSKSAVDVWNLNRVVFANSDANTMWDEIRKIGRAHV